jgi:P27 family predicted phage terminase small subunit
VTAVPDHLPELAKAIWLKLSIELDRLNLITQVDAGALEGVCVAYARAVEADKALAEKGMTIEVRQWDKKAEEFVVINETQRPEVNISHNCWRRYKEFCTEFGLTPASRGKLSIGDTGKKIDAVSEAIFG